ncbi:MAG: transposase [Vicinamibacterales bacterium]
MAHAITAENWDDPLMAIIRPAVRAAIEAAVEAELKAVLGAARYERIAGRVGYRHGSQTRTLGTPMGAIAVTVPRARVDSGGTTDEWHSGVIPRYQRRLRGLDETILGVYLTGTNQRKIAAALRPLLAGVALSKSAVSRLAGQLQVARGLDGTPDRGRVVRVSLPRWLCRAGCAGTAGS